MAQDRRWKVLWLSPECMLLPIQLWLNSCIVSRPIGVCIPEGCEVVDVAYDWNRRQFGLRLQHPSFPEVPDGAYAPELIAHDVEWRAYQTRIEEGVRPELVIVKED